jgi:hypothetical protein
VFEGAAYADPLCPGSLVSRIPCIMAGIGPATLDFAGLDYETWVTGPSPVMTPGGTGQGPS